MHYALIYSIKGLKFGVFGTKKEQICFELPLSCTQNKDI